MADYTIYFYEYLERGYTTPVNIEDFVELEIAGVTYNIKELFEKRNKYKEIGSETPELFKHNLEILIDEALARFNPALELLKNNYQSLLERTVNEQTNGYTSANGQNEDYLVPVNTNAQKLQNLNKSSNGVTYQETKGRSFAWLRSNPEILDLAMKLDTVVNNILKYLDKAFIGIF